VLWQKAHGVVRLYNEFRLGRGFVFPRIREIVDENAERLRVSLTDDFGGALITLERPDGAEPPRIVLDPRSAELLSSFIMSARLALPHGLPDEDSEQGLARRFRLIVSPTPLIEVTQGAARDPFQIPSRYWDKLYAELCLVVAHTRDLGWRLPVRTH
jgi:hypothetical protein